MIIKKRNGVYSVYCDGGCNTELGRGPTAEMARRAGRASKLREGMPWLASTKFEGLKEEDVCNTCKEQMLLAR